VEIRKKVVETAIRKRRNQSDKFNQKRKEPPKYKEKDLVLIRFDPPATGSSRKLLQRYRGPYEVKKILSADRYLVGDTEVTQMTQKPFESNKPIPFHTCHIDHAGPYPKTKSRKEYIFGIVDSFTGFTILRAVRSPDAQEAIKVLEDISQIFGVPTILISDRGAAFTSKKFKDFCEKNVIKHSLVAAKTPRANGKIERVFRIVGEGLKTMSEGESGNDWEKNLSAIQWAINSLRNRIT
uniref:Integrase catalytic domain-containing protein n=1 Tax=Phlebotomus papatasi TaxID=29031 RepID=A0A1B0D841_PHLPP